MFLLRAMLKLTDPITVEDYIKKILRRIEFNTEYQRYSIYDDPINSFSGIRKLTEKYISDISTEFARRNQDNGNIRFDMRITKSTK